MKILFVCSGNSCRSPMAELYFNFRCTQAGATGLQAQSAGCSTWDGMLISDQAATVLAGLGIDSRDFRSQQITRQLAGACELIIAMTTGHLHALQRFLPDMTDKIHRLGEYSDGADIPDPFGGSVQEYQRIFAVMKPALDNLFTTLNSTRS